MSDVTPPQPNEPTDGATPPPPPPPPPPAASTPPPAASTPPPAASTPPPPPVPPVGGTPAAPGMVPQNGMGTAALIMGILQFICLGPIASILAIIFGVVGLKKVKQGVANNRGVAMSGLVLGIIGIVLSVIALILVLALGVFAAKEVSAAIDPAKNAQTGLMDGMYGMEPTTYVNLTDRCSFTGVPISAETEMEAGPAVTVVGTNSSECGSGMMSPSAVIFEVNGGVAKVLTVQ